MKKFVKVIACAVTVSACAVVPSFDIGDTFSDGNFTYEKHGNHCSIVKVNNTDYETYTIPETAHGYIINEVLGDPFQECGYLQSVSIEADLEYVEDYIFWNDDSNVQLFISNSETAQYLNG